MFYGGCNFSFEIEVENEDVYENLLYGFVIKNNIGEPLIGINNRHTGNNFFIKKGEKITFKTEIPKLAIYKEGEYYVDLYWGNHGVSYEVLEDAFTFEVEKTDIFGTSNLLDPKLNLIYTNEVNLTMLKK